MRRLVFPTAAFSRTARRFLKRHPLAADTLREVLDLLAADAFDARLKTHKLKGDRAGSWACSTGYDLRIIFKLVQHEGAEAVLLQSVGTHEEVY